jgi:hypothetical protein
MLRVERVSFVGQDEESGYCRPVANCSLVYGFVRDSVKTEFLEL